MALKKALGAGYDRPYPNRVQTICYCHASPTHPQPVSLRQQLRPAATTERPWRQFPNWMWGKQH
jgi:hypothetical protein